MVWARKVQRRLVVFGRVWNSTHFCFSFSFWRSTFHGLPIIVKIFIYTMYICWNILALLFWANQIGESCYAIISFQSCWISFYIDNPRRFWNSVNETTKLISHDQQFSSQDLGSCGFRTSSLQTLDLLERASADAWQIRVPESVRIL